MKEKERDEEMGGDRQQRQDRKQIDRQTDRELHWVEITKTEHMNVRKRKEGWRGGGGVEPHTLTHEPSHLKHDTISHINTY